MFWLCVFTGFLVYWLLKSKKNKSAPDLPGFTFPTVFQQLYILCTIITAHDTNVAMFKVLYKICRMFLPYGIIKVQIGWKTFVVCFSSEAMQAILSNNKNIDKSFIYKFLKPWLKEGLIVSNGLKWKKRRKLLSHCFTYGKLKDYHVVINKNCRDLVMLLEDFDGKVIDIIPFMTRSTLDVLCETALGVSLNALNDENCAYYQGILKVGKIFSYRILRPWLWPDGIFYRTKFGQEAKNAMNTLNDIGMQIIQERKSQFRSQTLNKENDEFSCIKSLAVLDYLLYLQEVDGTISDNDILEEVNNFMFAGHDTTSYASSWCLYLLGMHPEIQKKVLEEIEAIFGEDTNRDVTMQDLQELNYLNCVIKESLRLFPSIPLFARHVNEDITIKRFTIPKGTTCVLFPYLLHRNPYAYFDPDVFNPDRFLPENSKGRHPFSFIPFSAGSRNCLGQKFALLEEKIILLHCLRNFTVETIEKDLAKLRLSGELALRPKYGLKIRLLKKNRKIA